MRRTRVARAERRVCVFFSDVKAEGRHDERAIARVRRDGAAGQRAAGVAAVRGVERRAGSRDETRGLDGIREPSTACASRLSRFTGRPEGPRLDSEGTSFAGRGIAWDRRRWVRTARRACRCSWPDSTPGGAPPCRTPPPRRSSGDASRPLAAARGCCVAPPETRRGQKHSGCERVSATGKSKLASFLKASVLHIGSANAANRGGSRRTRREAAWRRSRRRRGAWARRFRVRERTARPHSTSTRTRVARLRFPFPSSPRSSDVASNERSAHSKICRERRTPRTTDTTDRAARGYPSPTAPLPRRASPTKQA